jgi:NADPH-dependent curcumin reductase CurA
MKRPVGDIKDDDLQVRVEMLNCTLGNGEVLVRIEMVSLDPTHRIWMNDMESYLPPVSLGAVMRAGGSGYVVKSKDPKTPVGSYVGGLVGVQEYFIGKSNESKNIFTSVKVIPHSDSMPHSNFMSLLAPHIGGTAYTGTIDICGKNVNPGKTYVVSGASGAVGSLAAQIGKIRGARVIGIVGSKEKERRCLEDYKLDGVINYKVLKY